MIDLSNGQTDSQLEDVCLYKNINLTGIYMINDFDFNQNGNYILNLDSDNRGGTHWVSCIITNKYIFYFDSFGYEPPEIIKSKLKKKLFYNNIQFQNIEEKNCGIYCILFLKVCQSVNSLSKFNTLLESMKNIKIFF
jgi:hypothetical protein